MLCAGSLLAMSLSLSKIDDLIDALLQNAGELVAESLLLAQAGHFARAHATAHIAREELAKSMMLQAAAAKVLAGVVIDWKKLMKRFRNHNDKLKLEGVQSAVFLSAMGQSVQGMDTFNYAAEIAEYRNQRKNMALYVELNEGNISKPSDQFSEHQATRTRQLAQMWLEQQQTIRKTLGRYDQCDPARYKGMTVPDPNDIVTGDPAELLSVLGKAQSAIWAHLGKKSESG